MFAPFFPLQSSLNSAFHLFIIHINNFRLLLWVQINFIIHNIDNLRLVVSSLHKVLTLFIGVLQELDNHTVKKWDYISTRANQSKKAQPFLLRKKRLYANNVLQICFFFYDFFYSSLCGIALIVCLTSPVLPLVQSHAEICIQREQKNGIHDLILLTHRVLFFP